MTKERSAKKKGSHLAPGVKTALLPVARIQEAILVLRGQRVMLDFMLAELYDVETKALNQAVQRNRDRFPGDFMFALSSDEVAELNRSQTVTGSQRHRDPRYPPKAFTQEGVAMLSSVLRSRRAVAVNIEIMRAFVRLRRFLASNKEIAKKLAELEQKTSKHDTQFRAVFLAIRELMTERKQPKRTIGFKPGSDESR